MRSWSKGLTLMLAGGLLTSGWCVAAGSAPTTPSVAPTPWTEPRPPARPKYKKISANWTGGGDLMDSIHLKANKRGYRINRSVAVDPEALFKLDPGVKVYFMPPMGKSESSMSVDGWVDVKGLAAKPCYLGPWSGRTRVDVNGGGMAAKYCVIRNMDLSCNMGVMEFSNCTFINCTFSVEGQRGGRFQLTQCTLNNSEADKTAFKVSRSQLGPVFRLKSVKVIGYKNVFDITAVDGLKRMEWAVNDLQVEKLSGKFAVNTDPVRVSFGRLHVQGAADAAAVKAKIENGTPPRNMTGKPEVSVSMVSAQALANVGEDLPDPSAKDQDDKNTGSKSTGGKKTEHGDIVDD